MAVGGAYLAEFAEGAPGIYRNDYYLFGRDQFPAIAAMLNYRCQTAKDVMDQIREEVETISKNLTRPVG